MIVLKFGGTSLGDAQRLRQAARIALDQQGPRLVVVSAASGVTNALLEAARAAARGDDARRRKAVAFIHERHAHLLSSIESAPRMAEAADLLMPILDDLGVSLDRIAANGKPSAALSDLVVSTGEKCMSVLMAATMRDLGGDAVHVFAESVIATDDRHGSARPDRERTRANVASVLRPSLDAGKTVVVTGFIGAGPDGATTTLGRGGSDYSATLLGAALDANEVQIWTDVAGVLSADPRTVEGAQVVPEISYDEAQELAHFGAKVLHPRTIRPAVARNIPVRILSTFTPEAAGTVVTRESASERIKAVTAMRGLILLTVDVPELEDLAATASAVFRVMHEQGVEILTVSQASSRRRMTYLIDAVTGGCEWLNQKLEEETRDLDANISCREQVAVVAAVGQGAASKSETLSRMLSVLHRASVRVLATNQQSSNVAMLAVVDEHDVDRAVDAVHEAFIRPQVATARSKRRRRAEMIAEAVRVG